jgi:hypothetical protein
MEYRCSYETGFLFDFYTFSGLNKDKHFIIDNDLHNTFKDVIFYDIDSNEFIKDCHKKNSNFNWNNVK